MMDDLERAIRERHSTRKFLPTEVMRSLIVDALELARFAPSNSNIQPWRLFLASGPARARLRDALIEAAHHGSPNIPALPEAFQHYRRELGGQVYGSMGIARDDKEARAAAVLRNYEFFGAPLVGIVCMHRDLGPADALSVGMYLQTLVLGLTASGLGTCVEVSVAGYPEVVREQLGIPADLSVLCGLAVGHPDPNFPANQLHVGREPVEATVRFLEN